jgi:hypothetical protein
MMTIMMIFSVGMISFATFMWVGHVRHDNMHHTDLMAGDE